MSAVSVFQTLDMLDSASTFNAHVASKLPGGQFSHTAIVNRRGNEGVTSGDEYYTSESYESDYHSDHRRMPQSSR